MSNLPNDSDSGDLGSDDLALAEWVSDLAMRLRNGEDVDFEAFIREHPAHADSLRRLIPVIRMMATTGAPAETGAKAPPVGVSKEVRGDLEIVREIGR